MNENGFGRSVDCIYQCGDQPFFYPGLEKKIVLAAQELNIFSKNDY